MRRKIETELGWKPQTTWEGRFAENDSTGIRKIRIGSIASETARIAIIIKIITEWKSEQNENFNHGRKRNGRQSDD